MVLGKSSGKEFLRDDDYARGQALWLMGSGIQLCADAYGPEAGDPVLFFHGGGQSRRAWRGAARKVGKAGFRALTVDLRGHGESDWAPDGNYAIDAVATDIETVIESFDRPVVLVGASRGGLAALVAGSRRSKWIRLLMLADVVPKMRDEGLDQFRDFFRASEAGFATIDEAARALVIYLDRPHQAETAGLEQAMRPGNDGRLYWKWDPRTVAPEYIHSPSEAIIVERAAARVKCPVLLVRAELSNLVTDENVELFRRLTPQLNVEVVQGVGHMLTGDSNDVFADALLGRLSR